MVNHSARDAFQQLLIGPRQELDQYPPGSAIAAGELRDHAFPTLSILSETSLHCPEGDAFRNGLDEPPLLTEERPFVEGGTFLSIGHGDRPDRLSLHPDVGLQRPRGRHVVVRLVDVATHRDLGPADFRVFPSRRDDRNHLTKDVRLVVRGLLAQDLVDPVEAVELLGALLEVFQQLLRGSIGISHGHRPRC